jgi:hypothetical protein
MGWVRAERKEQGGREGRGGKEGRERAREEEQIYLS